MMDDPRTGQDLSRRATESIPRHAAALTTPIESFEQKPAAGI
jgi:hypothetical protein